MVSVIIPVYNAEKTLQECVDSVLNQTYSDYELILIDDGSKDRSGPICDQILNDCAKKGIGCQVIHQENGGVSKARNCGMDHANGRYFVCVDSDDIIEPCYLMDLVQTAEERPELGHVICGFKSTSNKRNYTMADGESLTIVSRRDYMLLHEKVLIQSPCLSLYRTEVVRKNELRMPEGLSLGEDLLFNLLYLDALGDIMIGIINKTNYIYQDEEQGSLNHKYRQDLLEICCDIAQAQSKYLKKWGVTDKASWDKYYYSVFLRYQNGLQNTFSKQNKMSYEEKLEFNNEVLKQELFLKALNYSADQIQPKLKRAYETGNYKRVLAVERLHKMKSTVRAILMKKRGRYND